MKQIVLIGASGHGKVVADIARCCGYDLISFLDDNPAIKECGGYPVIGSSCDIEKYDCDFSVSIGSGIIREKLMNLLYAKQKRLPVLIHPNAVIGENVSLGDGTVVMAGSVINPYVAVGKGCIINTCSSVDHDNEVGDYSHISVGAHLCGSVKVGSRTWIGAGAIVRNNITICPNCMIGAGAVVIKNIGEEGTYIGVPARKI